MTRRLVVSYLLVTAFALALLAVPLGITFAHHEKDRLLSQIEADADAMAARASYAIARNTPVPVDEINRYAAQTGGHVVIVDQHGIALVDTDHPKQPGLDYSTRPEIMRALNGDRVEGTRHSDTAGTTLLYAAVPTSANGRTNGAVRITYPTATLDNRVRRAWLQIALLCVAVLAAVAALAYVLARSMTRPLRRLEHATDRFAAGDFDARVAVEAGWPELRNLAERFNNMAAQLERLLDAQQRFVSDASHQLRTPLTALRLRLENLDAHVDASDRPAIQAATLEVDRLSRLVDGLLLLARDDSDDTLPVPVDVATVVRERADAWEDLLDAREHALTFDVPQHAWALAQPGAVEQLVDNLVDNALNASPAGTSIELAIERTGDEVRLHVLDRGPGLDAEARERAFDRFWRAPGNDTRGSGLGLAIVRRLTEGSGGRARLDARPGGGLDAVVVLTATREPAGLAGAH